MAELDIFEKPEASAAPTAPTASATPVKEIDDKQRLILQNIFDTDRNGRRQYLKEIGFEMDPKDDNKIKPLGSSGDFNMEIDPGIVDTWKKGGLWGLVKETGKDVNDIAIDIVKGSAVTAAGASGAAAGGVAGGIGAFPGFVLGAAAGSQTVEMMKTAARQIILDNKNVPIDMREKAMVTMFDSLGPKIAEGVVKQGVKGIKATVNAYGGALKFWAKRAGSGLTDDAINAIAENPSKFTPDKVEGATAKLGENFRNLFGFKPGEAVPDSPGFGSKFQEMLTPIKKQQTAEIEKLALDPRASFTTQELLEPIDQIVRKLQAKADLTAQEQAALNYFKLKADKIKSIGLKNFVTRTGVDLDAAEVQVKGMFNKGFQSADDIVGYKMKDPITGVVTEISPDKFQQLKAAGSKEINKFEPIFETNIKGTAGTGSVSKRVTPGQVDIITGKSKLPSEQDIASEKLNFKQVKEVLESVQHDAWDREIPGSQAIKQVFGGNKDQINGLLKAKADAVGSKFTQLTDDLAKKLNIYKRAADKLTPDNMITSFSGAGKETAKKAEIRLVSQELDDTFGTQFSKAVDDGTISSMVENAYRTANAPRGSEKVLKALSSSFNPATGSVFGAKKMVDLADPRRVQTDLAANLANSDALQAVINRLSSPGQLPMGSNAGLITQGISQQIRQGAEPLAGTLGFGQPNQTSQPIQTPQATPIIQPKKPGTLDIFEDQ